MPLISLSRVTRLCTAACMCALIASCGGGGDSAQGAAQPAAGWSLLAGSISEAGAVDGTGANARFNAPQGLTVDSAGNLLVSDSGNHAIRKIAPDGTVSTVAGVLGQAGAVDGVGAAARLDRPVGIHVVGSTAYFGDAGSHTFRRLASDGSVVTLAGLAGVAGVQDGTGSDARFNGPIVDVAADSAGNLYVSGDQVIRRITPAGTVATIAGQFVTPPSDPFHALADVDGTGAGARFASTAGLSLLPAGAGMYVSEDPACVDDISGSDCSSAIRKVTFDGQVTTLAALAGKFRIVGALPEQIAADESGALYGINWQLSRLANGGFVPIDVPLSDVPSGPFGAAVNVPAGGIALIAPKTFAVLRGSAVLKLVLP
jgi:hypothetical protein